MKVDTDWAIDIARSYRKTDTQAGQALRLLADAVLELRGENAALRRVIADELARSSQDRD